MYKPYDELGLYMAILPTGRKRWCWKYRFSGKEKMLRFGSYPVATLKMGMSATRHYKRWPMAKSPVWSVKSVRFGRLRK